jgi:hypothetical protein
MKTYRMNATMAGILYFLGTLFGVLSTVIGGEVISSTAKTKQIGGSDLIRLVSNNSSQLISGSFFILLMGISLVSMTIFLYPIFKKDSEELALGMVLFRGALEGVWYFITMLSFLALYALGQEYLATPAISDSLNSMVSVVYKFQDLLGPVGTIFFLIGATCLYVSFYRTRLIPRWLSVWGMIGVVPYSAYAIMHLFRMDNGIGFYLQMLLAPQEIVMALWLIIKGFKREAVADLMLSIQGE